jgi:hypothetical protein
MHKLKASPTTALILLAGGRCWLGWAGAPAYKEGRKEGRNPRRTCLQSSLCTGSNRQTTHSLLQMLARWLQGEALPSEWMIDVHGAGIKLEHQRIIPSATVVCPLFSIMCVVCKLWFLNLIPSECVSALPHHRHIDSLYLLSCKIQAKSNCNHATPYHYWTSSVF